MAKTSTKTYKYHTFTFPRPPTIPDDQLIIKDLSTFVRNHTQRKPDNSSLAYRTGTSNGNETALRMYPLFIEPDYPQLYHNKMFILMKQSLYSTQDRLKHLEVFLDKYQNDISFRAGFIFTKLDQMLDDMRRIYSYMLKRYDNARVYHNIMYYKHMTRKNVDITYIVEFLHSFHERNMKNLVKYSSLFAELA